jgi:hypothetical protein
LGDIIAGLDGGAMVGEYGSLSAGEGIGWAFNKLSAKDLRCSSA